MSEEINVRLVSLEHGHREVRCDVDEIQGHLYGNGKPGLLMLMDRMEQKGIGHSKAVVAASGILAGVIAAVAQVVAAMVAK